MTTPLTRPITVARRPALPRRLRALALLALVLAGAVPAIAAIEGWEHKFHATLSATADQLKTAPEFKYPARS